MEHDPGPAPHEVVRALAARRRADSQPGARADGLRIALVIEGGGMRGIISGGMALALDELGLVPAFDAVYGASAGSITGAWLLSLPEGLRVLSIRPAPGSPVSRLATDGALLHAALEVGRAAAHSALRGCCSGPEQHHGPFG